jgi:hypothetical protein
MRLFSSINGEREIHDRREGGIVKTRRYAGAFLLAFFSIWLRGYSGERFQAGVHFALGMPQGEFQTNVDRAGFGGSGFFVYRFKGSPFSAGVSLSVLVYGSETRAELLSFSIPEVQVDVTTRNYVLTSHFIFRVQPQEGGFRPYGEVLAGFHYLWTETGIYDQGWSNESIASSVDLNDLAWSFGAGCGVMMKVYETRKEGKRNPFALFVDLGARYLKGGKAEYLCGRSICQGNDRLIHDYGMSSTDLITARLGLSFVF